MKHLTFDEIFAFMQANEDIMSTDEILLVEKVSSHFDECERCLGIYNEIMARHSVAEFIFGAPIPLNEKKPTLVEAVRNNDLFNTVHAALRQISDTAVDYSNDFFDLLDRLLTDGFKIVPSSKATYTLAGASIRGLDDSSTEIEIIADSENSIVMEESGRINVNCSDKDAKSVLIVSKDGEFAELYQLIKKYGKNSATTNTLPASEYKAIFLYE